MIKKTLILSAAGLKNINPNTYNEQDEFCFFFGEHTVQLSKIFADFISPLISKMHQADPTICTYKFTSNDSMQEVFSENILSYFRLLSLGQKIEIDEKDARKLQILLILIENNELFELINEMFPHSSNEVEYLDNMVNLLIIQKYSINGMIDISDAIDEIAEHFESIDKNKLKLLPLHILIRIVSSDHLKLANEDSLLDFIFEVFKTERNSENCKVDIVDFYEKVEFVCLTREKLCEFMQKFDPNTMTQNLWRRLKDCFLLDINGKYEMLSNQSRYLSLDLQIEYNGNEDGAFRGIINYLANKSGGNVVEKGVMKVTSSSVSYDRLDKYAVDLNEINTYFQSKNQQNAWLKYDFVDKKVCPTFYSIRTRHDHCGRCWSNPKNWVIEGSNDNQDNGWTILDSRNDINFLDEKSKVYTFDIKNKSDEPKFYRYLRIRQTGLDTNGDYQLTLSALEYFGSIIYNNK